MKILTTLQYLIFLLACGFAGGYETGASPGQEVIVYLLLCAAGALILQFLKINIKERKLWQKH